MLVVISGRWRKGIEKKNKGERLELDIVSFEFLFLYGGKIGYIVVLGVCVFFDLIDCGINFVI